jgi:hypothetical protein
MPLLGSGYGLPDFGAAVGAFIDEVDLRHAPMRFDIPDIHREQPYTTGADNRSCLEFVVVLDIGWHDGSPHSGSTVNLNPSLT